MDLRACVAGLLFSAAALLLPPDCLAAPLMVEKNLFAQDRKPPSNDPTPAAAQSNKPALPPKSIQLDGVVVYGDTKKALIRVKGQIPGDEKRKGGSPYVSVKEGDKIGGYQVTRIESQSILLEREGEAYEVKLFAEGKVVPPPPPMPPSPDTGQQHGGPAAQPPGAVPGGRMPGQNPNQPFDAQGNIPPSDVGRNVAGQPGMPQPGMAGGMPPGMSQGMAPGNEERPLIGVSPDESGEEEEMAPEDEEVTEDEGVSGEEE